MGSVMAAKASQHTATNIAQKGASAMHKKYPAGKQTPPQLKAERTNLKAARLVLVSMPNWLVRKTQWQTQFGTSLRPQGIKTVLGSSLLTVHSSIQRQLSAYRFQAGTGTVHKPNAFGIHEPRAIGPTRSGGWGLGRQVHQRKYLYNRSRRTGFVAGWKRRGGSLRAG